ncbi:MAG TPA: HAD-IIIA family hydrolase, partial [Thermodesulfobacteriota bacterium]|nr:HAD-IIIA family hydrolase [Thermodesulfobacteriota bacterium]
MLLLDVDGVLTDGRFMYTDDGREYKCFHTQDGLGLRMMLREGIGVIVISGRSSPALEYRARELRLTAVYQGVDDKLSVFEEILEKNNLKPQEVGYVGDDLVDLPILKRVGFAVAVANAVDEVR